MNLFHLAISLLLAAASATLAMEGEEDCNLDQEMLEEHKMWAKDILTRLVPEEGRVCLDAQAEFGQCIGMEAAGPISEARRACHEEQMAMMDQMQDGGDMAMRMMDSQEEGECCMKEFAKRTMCTKTCVMKKLGYMNEDMSLNEEAFAACAEAGPLAGLYPCDDHVAKCFAIGRAMTCDNVMEFAEAFESGDYEFFQAVLDMGDEEGDAPVAMRMTEEEEEMTEEQFLAMAQNLATMKCLRFNYEHACQKKVAMALFESAGIPMPMDEEEEKEAPAEEEPVVMAG